MSDYKVVSQSTMTEWRTDGTLRFYDNGKLTGVLNGRWWKRWALRVRIALWR